MSEDEFLEARDLIAAAMARAKDVLDYISGDAETAQIDICEDDRACVTSWRADSDGYDGYNLEREEQFFPARLLFAPPEDVALWKAEEKKRLAAEDKAWHQNRQREQEAHEREVLAALREKYKDMEK